jgi:hypothetical protein
MALTFEDIGQILPNASVLVRRKISNLARYLSGGNEITGATTMQEIMLGLSEMERPVVNVPPVQPVAVAQVPAVPDVARGAPKVYVNPLEAYSGEPLDWEVWERSTRATIGQTNYSSFLTAPPTAGNVVEEHRNYEFYNMLLKATQEGAAAHILRGIANQDGHAAWNALHAWYGTAEMSRALVENTRTLIDALFLDEKSSASTYINNFIKYCQTLEGKGEGYTDRTKIEKFLQQITDLDYDVAVQILSGNPTATFDDCVRTIRDREQKLLVDANDQATKKSHHGKTKSAGDSTKKKDIPSIPGAILFSIEPQELHQDLINWWARWNHDGREIKPSELQFKKNTSGGTKEAPNSQPEGNSGGSNKDHDTNRSGLTGKRKKKARRTLTTQVGTKATELPRIKFKDESDSDESQSGDEDGESNATSGMVTGTKLAEPAARVKKPKKRRNPIVRRGRVSNEEPKGIIDPGTDFELIGGVGWKVLERLNHETQLDGALMGMSGDCLPVVTAVTAFDHKELGPVLLGVGAAAWDDRVEQTESLFNLHELRKHNIVVNDKAIRDGGLQSLEVDGITINLKFEDERILYIPLRKPMEEEMKDLVIHWLIPREPSSTSKLLARRNKMAIATEPASWEERLGNCPEMILVKTMACTTQLCSSPIEMENRESLHQHRKSRVLPLHPKRILGRTDSDTFFSSMKSVRGDNVLGTVPRHEAGLSSLACQVHCRQQCSVFAAK